MHQTEKDCGPACSSVVAKATAELTSVACDEDGHQNVFAGAPSSKKSFFGKVWGCITTIITIAIVIIGFTVFLVLLLAIPVTPIAAIVMGTTYLEDCPAEPKIPVFLIVWGCASIASDLITLGRQVSPQAKENKMLKVLESIAYAFSIGWFVAGNMLVYNTKNKFDTYPEADNFCDPELYWFAFWMNATTCALYGIWCVFMFFIMLLNYKPKVFTLTTRTETRFIIG